MTDAALPDPDPHERADRALPAAQLHSPRVGEMVAGILRDRILSGDLPEGSALPPTPDLAQEFRVSEPSMREAMRILETDGLVSVRRGRHGGAIVHTPDHEEVSRMIGFVLQSWKTTLADVRQATTILEPICASLCAARPERETIAEILERNNDTMRDALSASDWPAASAVSFEFHYLLIDECGNDSLRLLGGALHHLRKPHEDPPKHHYALMATKGEELLQDHVAVTKAIARGNGRRARDLCEQHSEQAGTWLEPHLDTDDIVSPALIHGTER